MKDITAGQQVRDRISGASGVFIERSFGGALVRWSNVADENGNYVSSVPLADLEPISND